MKGKFTNANFLFTWLCFCGTIEFSVVENQRGFFERFRFKHEKRCVGFLNPHELAHNSSCN